jgi:hypothetical protein
LFFATLEIPENAFDNLSEEFTLILREKFEGKNRSLFQYIMAASEKYIFLREKDNTAELLLLASGAVSPDLPEIQRTWYIENYEELRRYMSPELIFDEQAPIERGRYEELNRKIKLNKTFRQDLQGQIKALGRDKLFALGFDMIYLPLHYTVRYSPLRFLDFPKMRTITSHGDKIVLANSVYIDVISRSRIWVDKKIIELLDIRIACYEDMAKTLEGSAESVSFPHWYSDTVTGYWDIAGLPRAIEGSFFSPFPAASGPMPAVLTFRHDETGQEYFGWQLSAGGSSFLVFIDPKKSLKSIYRRENRTLAQPLGKRPLQLECTLYINPAANSEVEKNIIARCLAPFTRADRQGIDALIKFDGDVFEIREYPALHGSTLIFRGRKR